MNVSPGEVMEVMRSMLIVCIQMAGPLLLVSIAIGLIISIFQAATQIHEQTLTFVPKVLVIALMLLLLGNWFNALLSDFSLYVFDMMSRI